MSDWTDFGLRDVVVTILRDHAGSRLHHMGGSFLSAYQIALEIKARHEELFDRLKMPIGGLDTGERPSLAGYLARQLSESIKAGDPEIEGGFLSNLHLKALECGDGKETVTSSLTGTDRGVSLFRFIDRHSSRRS